MTFETRTPDSPQDEAAIRALIDTVNHALHNKDAAAALAPYAPGAIVFDLAPPLLSSIGTDRRNLQAWFDTWNGPIVREARDLHITVSGNIAFAHGFYRLSGTPVDAGGQSISFWMRATLGLRRDAGAWRIVHEHTSVPFTMDSNPRPAFDLQP